MFRFLVTSFVIASFILGVGFIALPVGVYLSGFFPGLLSAIFISLFTIASGYLYLEATLACPEGANMMSISRELIGSFGTWTGSVLLIYTHYAVLVSYYLLTIPMLSEMLEPILGYSLYPQAIQECLMRNKVTIIVMSV